jgi:demethylmenaquinone methyltransferase/2-methoxy-6-polyprenyl-1,4-benzoquinol methylase
MYLRHILPRIGGHFSKVPAAYRYLNETIETFPSGKSFCALLEKAQFRNVSLHRMALGAVTIYVGEK